MSSSPKYCEYQLAAQRQAELELARRQQAAEEAKRRKQAEQRERKRRLDLLRTQLIAEAQELKTNVQRQQAIYPQDLIHLTSRCDSLLDALHRGKNERELQNTAQESISISQSLSQAVSQKRRDDEEKERHLEIDIQNFQIIDLEHQINSIQVADATKFDAAGYNAARQAMAEVKSALTSGQPHLVRDPLLKAADLVQRHTTAVAHGHAEWMQRKVEAEVSVGDIQALLMGLRADPVVMRWHEALVADLATQAQQAVSAVAADQLESPAVILSNARLLASQLIEEANIAQLKADQRDYISRSIAETLAEMGFIVSGPRLEFTDHPSSASILRANKTAGKAIDVSVPTEGQIWYNAAGYPKMSASVVGGGTAPICDEAEAVLNDMRTVLEAEFGIHTSEIMWEGKVDPNRILTSKKQYRQLNQQERGAN